MKYINLTKGYKAIVDNEDYEWLNQWKWHAKISTGKTIYVERSKWYKNELGYRRHKTLRMHRVIINPSEDKMIDHINHNGLDNRRNNLRIVSNSQNQMNRLISKNNTSGYTGVYLFKNKWRAEIRINNKHITLGDFIDKQHAWLARRWGERIYYK